MLTQEAYLKQQIKSWLKDRGAYFYMAVPHGYGRQTIDFLCCWEGRFLGIETKAPGKKPTPRQMVCLNEIKAAGGIAIWCDSFEDFLEQIATITIDLAGR